ncbi:MAG TPA: DM13 domain-containing protein [Gemmatimonadaceae bacterium]|nr:DM13 domain-containing protein [Gemmatimonadaceae bacterium]
MSSRRRILLFAGTLLLVAGWYFFRPERAVLDREVAEAAPTDAASKVAQGDFESRAHDTRGSVRVLELADGSRVLRLENFETSDGPDLQVYLLVSPDVSNGAQLNEAGFVSLGPLKGNIGEQNYVIPGGVDLTRYRAVSIWCRRFGVNFATARLLPSDRT